VKEDLEEQFAAVKVKQGGNSRRIYLTPNWVGRLVKIVRLD
jgi:hypothetical protein